MADYPDFILIGAGLPRTGTMSTRVALQQLLKGDIYHMATVAHERPDHHPLWRKAMEKKESVEDWQTTLADFRGGVDYPISNHYQELMVAFPNAKVLLNVRDPVKWYTSVKESIFKAHSTMDSWPCSWFFTLLGRKDTNDLVGQMSRHPPKWSTSGLGMFGAVSAGEEKAVQFYHDHVNEVKAHVPADRLLVWEVKEGWAPLCKFLDVPVPDGPFPRVNDTEKINGMRKMFLRVSWFCIVIVPAAMALGAYYFNLNTPTPYLSMIGGYMLVFGLLRSMASPSILKPSKEKKE